MGPSLIVAAEQEPNMLRRIVPLIVCLALVACGGSPSPAALVSSTSDKTTEAGTARMSLESTVRGIPGASNLSSTAEGVVDFEAQRGSLTLSLPEAAAAGMGAGDLRFVYDGTVIYLRSPGALPGVATEWISLDFGALSEQVSGTDIEQFAQAGSNDPSNSLTLLKGTSESIEELGTEDVRGEETTHYRATVDLRKAAEQAGAVRDQRQFEAFLDQFPSETIPVEVWLDEEGRTRRMRVDQPIPETPGMSVPPDAGVIMTIELYDFGVDEAIEIPPSDQVTDLTSQFSDVVDGATTTTTG
ncbi:MAG TPA: hypothetical protein VK975_01285 [Acidimicrobiales bacterium]|nr:hypothetical protein [Acidimicrobiales bacterium]